jgi:pentatricopeptide repeat protein
MGARILGLKEKRSVMFPSYQINTNGGIMQFTITSFALIIFSSQPIFAMDYNAKRARKADEPIHAAKRSRTGTAQIGNDKIIDGFLNSRRGREDVLRVADANFHKLIDRVSSDKSDHYDIAHDGLFLWNQLKGVEGLELDLVIYRTMITLFVKTREFFYAEKVFDEMMKNPKIDQTDEALAPMLTSMIHVYHNLKRWSAVRNIGTWARNIPNIKLSSKHEDIIADAQYRTNEHEADAFHWNFCDEKKIKSLNGDFDY